MRVDWSYRSEYVRRRHGVLTKWADEAVNDDLALWFDPDPKGRSGDSVRVVGFSRSAEQVLVVIVVRDESLQHADYWGANSWRADGRERRMYESGG